MHGRLLDATASDVWTQSHPEPGAPCPPPGELSPFVFLLAANILLLILGCVLEGTTILLTFVPVLLPTAQALGIDPVHFGVIVVVNIMIGLCSPPYGLLLLMMAKITGVPLKDIVKEIMPFHASMVITLVLITYVPWLTLVLPD